MGKNLSPYIVALKGNIRYFKDYVLTDKNGNTARKPRTFSPISGYEPKYNAKLWNNPLTRVEHNCYAYVINTIAQRTGKPQPGYFSGFPPMGDDDYHCEEFYRRLKKDIPSLYLTTFTERCKPGFYKGFLAIDPKKEDPDYHFYRQDRNGYWSHKPGRLDAVNYDASSQKILNPFFADRKYQHYNYSTPCFFFCLNSRLARGHSYSRFY